MHIPTLCPQLAEATEARVRFPRVRSWDTGAILDRRISIKRKRNRHHRCTVRPTSGVISLPSLASPALCLRPVLGLGLLQSPTVSTRRRQTHVAIDTGADSGRDNAPTIPQPCSLRKDTRTFGLRLEL